LRPPAHQSPWLASQSTTDGAVVKGEGGTETSQRGKGRTRIKVNNAWIIVEFAQENKNEKKTKRRYGLLILVVNLKFEVLSGRSAFAVAYGHGGALIRQLPRRRGLGHDPPDRVGYRSLPGARGHMVPQLPLRLLPPLQLAGSQPLPNGSLGLHRGGVVVWGDPFRDGH